jgi:hypothetical protein
MKCGRLSFLLLGLAVGAVPGRGEKWVQLELPKMPEIPAKILARFQGSPRPAVGAKKGRFIVLVDDRLETADPDAPLILSVGDGYALGFVTITESKMTRYHGTDNEQLYTAFEGKVTSQTELTRVLLVVVAFTYNEYRDYTTISSRDRPFAFTMMAEPIDHLAAGKPKKVSVSFPALKTAPEENSLWTAVVFANGRQVRTTGVSNMLPWFFEAQSRCNHRRLLDERGKRGTAPVEIYRNLPLDAPPEIKTKYGGQTVVVMLEIDRTAHITGIQLPETDDPQLRDFLYDRMAKLWLFLPCVREGENQTGFLQLKLRF